MMNVPFSNGKRMYFSKGTWTAIEAEWDKEDDRGLGWSEEKIEYKMNKLQMKRQEYKAEINNLQLELKKAGAREKNMFFFLYL